jgi:glucosamine--fructose-6-phosphate aminotransferase (isomerizing)
LESNTCQIVEGQYLADILDQPRALAATLQQMQIPKELSLLAGRLREGDFKRVVLTGMGASFHALHPLLLCLNAFGYEAAKAETSELIYSFEQWLDPHTLIVAVSQSGQSAEIVRLVEENRSRASIVGVTNTSDSELALRADALILTMAGKEFSVSCKTYMTALMALYSIGGILCGCDASQTQENLAQTVFAVTSYLREWKAHVFEMTDQLRPSRQFFLLGRGASLAASGDGALIVKESVRLHAESMSGAAFRHGPLEMVNRETFAVVFAGSEPTIALQAKLRDDIRRAGGGTGWITEDDSPGAWSLPKTALGVHPMLEILPVQMMTLALAAQTGIEAGRFARVSKITTTE